MSLKLTLAIFDASSKHQVLQKHPICKLKSFLKQCCITLYLHWSCWSPIFPETNFFHLCHFLILISTIKYMGQIYNTVTHKKWQETYLFVFQKQLLYISAFLCIVKVVQSIIPNKSDWAWINFLSYSELWLWIVVYLSSHKLHGCIGPIPHFFESW